LLTTAVTGAVSGINTFNNMNQQNYLDEQQESIKSVQISVDTLTTSLNNLEAKVTALQTTSSTSNCKLFYLYQNSILKYFQKIVFFN